MEAVSARVAFREALSLGNFALALKLFGVATVQH